MHSNFREQHEEKATENRLYIEVRFCKHTCVSLPKSSDVFRLKRNHKNLSIDEYATNLKLYLEKVDANTSATAEDFANALSKLF